tara:strand:- start:2359 stop:3876 length:1518 start_codon:yes stop_codon:yes gene_type:complete
MANTIKFKRASGSDPSASDLAIGEPGLRTDTAELFFKKDDGTVAKVSGGGGGPNFKYLELRNAANNGAASFPGNDFTLVTAGTTTAISPSAANTLLVSVSGVIQKPNAGTSTSGITGFIIDGSRFKTATNLPAAPDFIIFQESGGIGEPSDNTVTSAKIVDGAIVNADINASAAIAGSKIDPTFTSTVNVTNNLPEIFLTDSNSSNARARLNANGGGLLLGADNDNAHANSSISFEVDGSNKMFIDSSGNVGIGTTSLSAKLHVNGDLFFGGNASVEAGISNGSLTLVGGSTFKGGRIVLSGGSGSDDIRFTTSGASTTNTERMRITSGGSLCIGVDVPANSEKLRVDSTGSTGTVFLRHGSTDDVAMMIMRHSRNTGGSAASYINFQDSGGTRRGFIDATTSGTTYSTSSDYRLKENITAISDGITRLKTLKPSKFNFIGDSKIVDGFLAHEVTAVPEAVTGTKDEVDADNNPVYQGIDQSKLVPLLVAALQEAIGRIEALEAK